MTGVHYWRCKRRLTSTALVKLCGVNEKTLRNMEREFQPAVSLHQYIKVAEALQTSVESIFEIYPENALNDSDRPDRSGLANSPVVNLIGQYRKQQNLTYKQLAERYGATSREFGRLLCNAPKPSKAAIKAFADFEKISVEEFEKLYEVNKEEAV